MNFMTIQKLRIAIASVVFIAFCVIFLCSADFAQTIATFLLYLQVIPSLLSFISGELIALGFILILTATLLWGRVYCSFLCPLGIFQDIIIFLTNRVKKIAGVKPKRTGFHHTHGWLKYSILVLFLGAIVSGFFAIVSILDPYSIFGRIFTHLLAPLVDGGRNLLVSVLGKMGIYSLASVAVTPFEILSFSIALASLLVVLILSIGWGRSYCNNVCPVGSFLGLLARFSLHKIVLDDKCKGCRLCELACKAHCMDVKAKKIDYANCVACFNCTNACKNKLLAFTRTAGKKPAAESVDISRRVFLNSGLAAGGLILGAGAMRYCKNQELEGVQTGTNIPVLPPGAVSLQHFSKTCTACHVCVSQCPTKVLRPAVAEYGWTGIMQPLLDFRKGFCEYECNRCSEVCPANAIQKVEKEDKKHLQIGVVSLRKEHCIVSVKKVDCGACAEHCPTHAVSTIPYQNDLYGPEINPSLCVGCGACQHACPTSPKAIVVTGNAIQRKITLP